ncbi:LysR substrate-binding domain-containing protein [Planotetraspora phitsanulokensis]|uniref:LysR family transcriptional regulator n=1 Tax=Planotetraspora phitsanulokensis TaxID=575192 RepID=A0A8J3UIN4_9ACTN|nr:LysR substrate-binding domain-containing protein [Planotetraspora phitsanulokensis]GII43004.1 LysR family transcriptional regulator [Planotetraspora phitsanulokensis]
MELRQLRYVVAVAEEGSFTRAAARVHVAQPAISQQIAQLERELGERLFDRTERKVSLTPAGEAFLPHARAALQSTAAGRDAVTLLRGVLAGRLAVGTVPAPPATLLDQLARFQRHYPQVRLTLRTGDPEKLVEQVIAGNLDTALIGTSGPRLPAGPAGQRLPTTLGAREFGEEPLVVATAPGHPLAANAEVTLADLREEALVTLTPGTGLRAALENACAEAGLAPDIRAETDDLSLLAPLVEHGFGIALMPRSAAWRLGLGLVTLPLRHAALGRALTLVWRRDGVTAQARAFLEMDLE